MEAPHFFLYYDFIYHLIYFFNDAKLMGSFATSDVQVAPKENFLMIPNLYLKSTHQMMDKNWCTMKLDKT